VYRYCREGGSPVSQVGVGLSSKTGAHSVQTAGSQPLGDTAHRQAGRGKIRRGLERSVRTSVYIVTKKTKTTLKLVRDFVLCSFCQFKTVSTVSPKPICTRFLEFWFSFMRSTCRLYAATLYFIIIFSLFWKHRTKQCQKIQKITVCVQ